MYNEDLKLSVLISNRIAMGMSLSKFEVALKDPLNQYQVPHLPGGGSIVYHPFLDEPYFVNTGSQAMDFIESKCVEEYKKIVENNDINEEDYANKLYNYYTKYKKPDAILAGKIYIYINIK